MLDKNSEAPPYTTQKKEWQDTPASPGLPPEGGSLSLSKDEVKTSSASSFFKPDPTVTNEKKGGENLIRPSMALTKNKQNFLKNLDDKELKPSAITAKELEIHAAHYLKKYNITIIINGETSWGRACNAKKTDLHTKIAELETANIRIGRYIYDQWVLSNNYHASRSGDRFSLIDLYTRVEFTGGAVDLNPALNLLCNLQFKFNKITFLPAILEELSKIFEKNSAELMPGVEKYLKSLQGELNLSHAEMLQEIKLIQQSLLPGQLVGYIYTNGASLHATDHVEGLIISKSFFLKPMTWPYPRGQSSSHPGLTRHILAGNFTEERFYDCDISYLGPPFGILSKEKIKGKEYCTYGPYPPVAQSELEGCGAFALKALKVFLKNRGEMLKNFALQIAYLDKENKLGYFLFPPPDLLFYSQSRQYNKAIVSLLSDADSVDILCITINSDSVKNKQNFPFQTIRGLLVESIKRAEINETSGWVAQHNKVILAGLNTFRERWLAQYEIVMQKHQLMDWKDRNRALLYATRQFEQKSLEEKKKNTPVTRKDFPLSFIDSKVRVPAPNLSTSASATSTLSTTIPVGVSINSASVQDDSNDLTQPGKR